MQHEDHHYVDTAFGGVHRRNRVLSIAELKNQLPKDKTDCFVTWHRFPEDYSTHCTNTGSVTGYQGSSFADFLPFDFDGDNPSVVLERVRDFLKILEVTYEIDGLSGVRCYFSGKKGFHILLSSFLFGSWQPSSDLHRQLHQLAKTMAKDCEADLSIYDQNRLLRLPDTRHGESNMWKISLHAHEVLTLSIDDITALAAKGSRDIEFPAWDDVGTAPPCEALYKDIARKPTSAETFKIEPAQNLFPTGMKEGDGRDNAAFRIARYCRDKRIESEVALDILRLWDTQQVNALGDQVLEQKVTSAYSRFVGEDESDAITAADIKSPNELIAEYDTYVEKLKTHKIRLGWPEVDARLRGIAPGEVLTLIARSGVGKTAVLQNILRHIALSQDAISLFCSLEQPLAQVFERFAQMSTQETGEDIEIGWDTPMTRERIAAAVSKDLGEHVYVCGRSGLRMEQLEQALDATQAKAKHPVSVLAVDYLGLLDTRDLDKNLYGQISRAAREMKNLAKRRDLAVLCLCQVSRANGEDGSKPLNIYSARESGAIEESADFLLGLYRPNLHDEDDNVITVQILKNRKGQDGIEFPYAFDKKSLRVQQPKLELIKHEY